MSASLSPDHLFELFSVLHPDINLDRAQFNAPMNGIQEFNQAFIKILDCVISKKDVNGSSFQLIRPNCNDEDRFIFSDESASRQLSNLNVDTLRCKIHPICEYNIAPYTIYWIRTITGPTIEDYLRYLKSNSKYKPAKSRTEYSIAALVLYDQEQFKCIIVLTKDSGYKIIPETYSNTSISQIFNQFAIRKILYQKGRQGKDFEAFCFIVQNDKERPVFEEQPKNINDELPTEATEVGVNNQKEKELLEEIQKANNLRELKNNENEEIILPVKNLEVRSPALVPKHELLFHVDAGEENEDSRYIGKAYQTNFAQRFLQFRYYEVRFDRNKKENSKICRNCELFNPKYQRLCLRCSEVLNQGLD